MDATLSGGSFLVEAAVPEDVFTPEEFTSEQRLYAKTARDFMDNEVIPNSERIESKDFAFTRGLLEKAGELGLLMADVPEAYGGLALDKASSALIVENISGQGAFQTILMGTTGIGTLPTVYYGTPELKAKYLPGLADGSLVGCYCLTEPGAGSDALAARTRAVLSDDGRHYLLNGTKQFITNTRIGDLLTVFAKVDGEHFTGFLVERDTPGVTLGPEEHKLGLHGSSTSTVIFEDAPVPVENVLGEIGRGHKIAFNILNIGRFKLGAGSVGSGKRALEHALAYTLERKQFGRRIAEFGAVREKLAGMFVELYTAESAVYRTVGRIDRLLAREGGEGGGDAALRSIEEYAVECSLVKVLGTEVLDFVVDEALQCFGGYGYCADYPMERFYRDSRIKRIYEGTNEINRILIPTTLLRRASVGGPPVLDPAPEGAAEPAVGPLGVELAVVENLRRIARDALGAAARAHGTRLADRQMVLTRLADLVLYAYAAESVVLRAAKVQGRRGEGAATAVAAARIVCEDAAVRAGAVARQLYPALESGPVLEAALAEVGQRLLRPPVDTLALFEQIAARMVELERIVV